MPDICFFDVVMRRMNGDEAVRRVRQAGWTCPIIATTGNVTDEEMLLKSGFDQVIFKPFTAKQIDQAIVQWVENKQNKKTDATAAAASTTVVPMTAGVKAMSV